MNQILMSVNDATIRYSISRAKMYQIMKHDDAPETLKMDGKRLIPITEFDDFIMKTYAYREMNDRPRRTKNKIRDVQ